MNIYYEQFSHLNKNEHFFNRYLKLVSIFKERNLSKSKGLENHHILPKSFGGSNKKENMVYLSPKEHFIIHHLLWKSFPETGMTYAFFKMSHCKRYNNKITSKVYEQLRNENSLKQSTDRKGKPAHNKGIPMSEEQKQQQSDIMKGRTQSAEHIKNKSNAQRGLKRKPFTEEHKNNISKAKKIK